MAKPIDRWFTLFAVVLGIAMIWIPRTPAFLIGSLVVMFILLFHQTWNFWWIEKKLWRRCCALLFVAICLSAFGYDVWPNRAYKINAFPSEIHLKRHTNKPFRLKLTNNEDFAIFDVNLSICMDNKILNPCSTKLIPVKNEDNPNVPFSMLRIGFSNGCCGIVIQDINPHSTKEFNVTIIGENMEIDSKVSFSIYDWSRESSLSIFSSTGTKNLQELLSVPLKPGEKRTLSENINLKVPLNPYFPQEKETRVLLPPELLIDSNLSTQRDSINITSFDSKNRIVLYNSGDRKVFVSHLSLRSVEHGYSGVILIEKTVDIKSYLTHDLKTPNMELSKWGVGSISEDSWHQLLSSQHLKETRCIQWHFFVLEDPGYKTMKESFGNSFHEVSITGTIFCRQNDHQFKKDVKVFAVPFINQDCIAADRTFTFR